MNPSTEERVEIKAGAFFLNVPFTTEGLELGRAMLKFLEPTPFFPPKSSPKQRIKFKEWEAVANTETGVRIYKEVLNRMLEEYKEGVEPKTKTFSQIIREMYGEQLKKDSIATYVSMYKRYIKENELATKPPQEKDSVKSVLDKSTKSLEEDINYLNPKGKEPLSMEKVVEIWDMLPDEFEYKQVKALVPVSIMQSEGRVEATNYIIKQFLSIPEFGCEEPSPGVFLKRGAGGEENDEEGGGEE